MRRLAFLALVPALVPIGTLVGCSAEETAPSAMLPAGLADVAPPPGPKQDPIDLTDRVFARDIVEAEIIDTRSWDPQIGRDGPWEGEIRRTKDVLPAHEFDWVVPEGMPNTMSVGGMLDVERVTPGVQFPGIDQTAWNPPDPTLAVGPDHVVMTVNMSIAFYTRDGVEQFYQILSSDGSPGFFEPVGGGTFTFDPKCFFDHEAQRFVVVAPEVYGSSEAWLSIAISDDADPNGIWYKYRTNAVLQVGNATYWWDYPGFGFDSDAYYVTSNLFGLNQGGFGGVGFRIFEKAPMLSGDPIVFTTLRDGGGASAQVAQHHGDNAAPYFVSVASSSSIRVQAIEDPLGTPSIRTQTISVPSFGGTVAASGQGGTVSPIDGRILNAHWRDGNLYTTHDVGVAGRNVARWYHFDTGDWPDAGSVSLVQSGNVDPGAGAHTFFPAIYSDADGGVGMVIGTIRSDQFIAVSVTGRHANDPVGTMGNIVDTHVANAGGGGRWGDYYDICIDPLDDRTYWVVGEYPTRTGWSNWIASFVIDDVSCAIDLNGDTLIDFFDILAFLVGFEDQDPAYDWDGDGKYTIFDVIQFLGEFEAGC